MVALGDTVVDAFIKLKEAHVTCKIDNTECEICMKFADKIPYESVEVINGVGNSANAAVSAARLGLHTALITNLGDDSYAKDVLEYFKKEKVSTEFVKENKGKKTNYHYVLWYGAERTILIKHEDYEYTFPKNLKTNWLYLSSLGEKSLPLHSEIANYLSENTETKLVFQPGTYQIRFGKEALQEIYKRTEIFFCNKEEAAKILGVADTNIPSLMKQIAELGPKIVVLTDGPNGAYALRDGKTFFAPPYPDPKPPFERTGAGDAYASTFASAIAKGKSTEEALLWAGVNSMSVVQDVGAQKGLLSEEKIQEWLQKAPESYKVKEI